MVLVPKTFVGLCCDQGLTYTNCRLDFLKRFVTPEVTPEVTSSNKIMSSYSLSKYISVKSALLGLRQFLATERPLEMMKNAFYLPQKLFSFSRYLSFCLYFLVMYRNSLIKKIRLISNFMTSQSG